MPGGTVATMRRLGETESYWYVHLIMDGTFLFLNGKEGCVSLLSSSSLSVACEHRLAADPNS